MSSRAANIRSKVHNTLLRFLLCRKITCLVTLSGHDIDKLAMVRFFEGFFDLFNAKGGMTQANNTSYYSIASYIPAVLM